ncbi:MAG: contractile injection system tape measure protein, partial [Cyanobacteria bacterium P01_F01_bin.150]
MSYQQHHIIGRTVLELDSGTLADVWDLQETLSRLLQQQIVTDLEPVFNELVGEDEVIRLDQVEVDLGAIAPHSLEQEFAPALVKAVRETLSDRILQAQLQRQAQGGQREQGEQGRQREQGGQSADTALVRQSQVGAAGELLLYFLRYGRLPWWQMETDWHTWLDQWRSVIVNTSSWQQPLRQLLATHPVAQRRLIAQFPKDFCHQLIRYLHPTGPECLRLLTQVHQLTQALGLDTSTQAMLDRAAIYLLLEELPPGQSSAVSFPTLRWMGHWLDLLLQKPMGQSTASFPPSAWMRRWLSTVRQTWQFQPKPGSGKTSAQRAYPQLYRALAKLPATERRLWQTAIEQGLSSTAPPATPPVTPSPAAPANPNLEVDPHTEASPNLSQEPGQSIDHPFDQDGISTQGRDRPPNLPATLPPSIPRDVTESSDGVTEPSPGDGTSIEEDGAIASPDAWAVESSIKSGPDTAEKGAIASPNSGSNLPFPGLGHWGGDRPSGSSSVLLSAEEESSGIYINQAGLVLLHPFLTTYFRAVGLIEKDVFCDETAQQTAIYLLHYLVTGQTGVPEYELVLPKLLCGWPLNEAMIPDIALSDAALEEGENLLQTVIDYWQALKSASPDGLREGFLQRQGKLTHTGEQNWTLRVEQMAIDVLLTRLPWGVSMVKLPWMDGLLTVEWT